MTHDESSGTYAPSLQLRQDVALVHMRPVDLVICLDPEYQDVASEMHGSDVRALEPIESDALTSLRNSIVTHGFFFDKPVTVSLIHGRYVVIDGTRRVRVCRVIPSIQTIPCAVIPVGATGDTVTQSLMRNVARQSTQLERAHEVKRLVDSGRTLEQVCAMITDSDGRRMQLQTARKLLQVATSLIQPAQECIRRHDSGETSPRAIPFWTLQHLAALHPVAQQKALDKIVAKRLEGDVVDSRAGAQIAAGVATVPRPSMRSVRTLGTSAGLVRENPSVALVLQWVAGDLPESDLPRLRSTLERFDPSVFAKQTKLG
jgi:hypothetical protein